MEYLGKDGRSFVVRRMEAADVAAVAGLEEDIFSRPWSRDAFLRALKSPGEHFFLAEGRICGPEGADGGNKCCLLGYCNLTVAGDTADVSNIASAPWLRGLGVGDALMRHMLSEARACGVAEVFLEVRVSNRPAIQLYQKYGFVQVGIRKGYYSQPKEDAWLMRAELAQ